MPPEDADRGPEPAGAVDLAALHAPFRPRRGPRVAAVVGVLALAGSIVLALAVPGEVLLADRAGFLLIGIGVAWFMQRQATVVAVPDERGLLVRNLTTRRRLEWAQIVEVRFGGGRPWAQLDLSDGDVLAVMGVQSADGPRAEGEARRLATLVALHTRTPHDR